jgi:hypothetical protein
MKLAKIMLTATACLLLFGCAGQRQLGQIPQTSEDFSLPQKELIEKYPEIAMYEKGHYIFGHCTSIEELTVAWGEPKEKKFKWFTFPATYAPLFFLAGGAQGGGIGTGIVLAMYPVPAQEYFYEKGKYTVKVLVDKSFYCGYKARLWTWEWITSEKQATKTGNFDVGK